MCYLKLNKQQLMKLFFVVYIEYVAADNDVFCGGCKNSVQGLGRKKLKQTMNWLGNTSK